MIENAKIFHTGSISLISEPSQSATLAALETARENHVLISYDQNLRLVLWPDAIAAKTGILSIWEQADLIKVSEDELQFLTGKDDVDDAVSDLWHENLKLKVVTLGRQDCQYYTPDFSGFVPGFQVKAINTTGAGDGFVAGLISGLLKFQQIWLAEDLLVEICRRANAVGALTTTRLGAISALPSSAQLDAFLDVQDAIQY